uniref:Abi family protein n=1 Tax=Eubacterium sp. TaxID=142586 RepID=UPI004025EAC5
MNPKSINALMKYMREEKDIQINGSKQKKQLRTMGYYHGYKGYRYCHSPIKKFNFKNFNELQAVYDFDMRIKSIFYPQIMFLETAIKNYSLEIIIREAKSDRFADIYSKLLNDYKSESVGSKPHKSKIEKRMALRNKIYNNISRDYGRNNIISHYYDKDNPVPIWAIFEILSLGEFGNFFSCLNIDTRIKISKSIGIKSSFDSDGRMVQNIVYLLKDLRNSVAHNNTIFDTRFRTHKINNSLKNYISKEININNINFLCIVDYLILIAFVMKLLNCNKTVIYAFIRQFEDACENLRKQVPIHIFSKIVYTDTKRKIAALKKFL